ncbi:MAG: DUF4192 domain-containing protein [Acidobacteriota bacterium]|nr:DUF4192 domain-containing protein [Acidobacteriota bacterium]
MKPDKHPQDSISNNPDLELMDSPLRLRGGQDVASLIPYLLGFHPHDSIVALVCIDGRLLMTARMPIGMADHPLELDDQIRRISNRAQGADWILVGYGNDRPRVNDALHLTRDLVGSDNVIDVLYVSGDRYWSLTCTNPSCCPPEGVRFDAAYSPAALQAVVAGLQVVDNRECLKERIRPPRGWTARGARFRLDDAHDLIRRLGPDAAGQRLEELLATGLDDPADLKLEDLAMLSALSYYGDMRDISYRQLTRANADRHVQLWQAVVRATARDDQGCALALLALACWVSGDGAMQVVCMERASKLVPDLGLLHILHDLNRSAAPPTLWDDLVADMFRGDHEQVSDCELMVEE